MTNCKTDLKKFLNTILHDYKERERYIRKFSWAIPSDEAIQTIVEHSPIVEMGAGTGYWAKLIAEAGADIDAYDQNPCDVHFNIQSGRPPTVRVYTNRTLFLCWPPYNTPMAYQCLDNYRGNTIIYVGEGYGGCTGCDLFHETLRRDYTEVKHVHIQQWYGLHDILTVWKR